MKLLVVEDNEQSRYLLQQYLTARQHVVWSAKNGREALSLCQAQGVPDAVISDALMPAMDGFELCYAIRRDPALCSVPFILYTATYTAESDERFALSVGVDRFVVKPIEPDRLLQVVEDLVKTLEGRPARKPEQMDPRPSFLEEYARVVSVKLEDKLGELAKANASLQASEKSVRELNDRLLNSVQRLEKEIVERRRTEELLILAQHVGGLGSWEMEPGSGEVIWSEQALRILGREGAGELSVEQFLTGVEPGQRDAARSFLQASAKRDEPPRILEMEYTVPGKKERRYICLRSQQMSLAFNAAPRRIGTVQDITERKEAEAQRQSLEQQLFTAQKMEALGNLAGGIAHDFNNMLTAIFGNSELLKLELASIKSGPQWREPLAEILNAAERSRDTIRQILMFSRRQPVEKKAVLFARVVEEGLRLVRSTLNRRIELKVNLSSERHALVSETQIQQVLLNLCTNAAHAMGPNGGTLGIEVESVDLTPDPKQARIGRRAGAHVRLRVSDTGKGIEPHLLDRIFEPFYTTKPSGEGTGLGLAVVHGIVQSHDGTVTVESALGKGTTFTLLFPAVSAGPAEVTPGSLPPEIPRGQGRRILVVDDEPSVAHLCERLLTRIGYKATAINEAVEARTLFLRDPQAFDGAVVDYLMPRLNGIDLIRAMRTVRPDFPVLLVAGFGGQLDAVKARAEGVSEILAKPFAVGSLAESLARVLGTPPTQ